MEALGIDYKLLLAQVINFVLFYLIFKKYLAEPFFTYMDKVKKREKEKDKILDNVKEKEEETEKKEKEILDTAAKQAANILNEANKSAQKVKEDTLRKARTEGRELRKKFENQLKEDKRKLYRSFRTDVIETSSQMLEAVLKKFVDKKQQSRLVENLVKTIKKRKV